MSRVRTFLEDLYESVPSVRPLMRAVNRAVKTPTFEGWGMSNHHALPWDDTVDWRHFERAARHARDGFEHGLRSDTAITPAMVDGLRWRHWIVSFSARYAATFAGGDAVTLVECGVGDGLTAYFACSELEHLGRPYRLHGYDAWAPVTTDLGHQDYAGLDLARTQRNLAGLNVTYHRGLIPEVFDAGAPDGVHYLSVDLNTARPTIDTLEFFLPRLAPRAVVLFDDYGFAAFADTRVAVDEFLAGRRGALMKLPTGQAAWFN